MEDTERKHLPVYVIDDVESVRKAVKRLVNSFGYSAETFDSAESFLVSGHAGEKAVLILDERMPSMDGFGLQEKLSQASSPMKVIFLTGDAQQGDRERALMRGATGFFRKPFDDQSLLDLIQAIEISKEE
jgi:two-component system, LuxR family, response regulator TtrR